MFERCGGAIAVKLRVQPASASSDLGPLPRVPAPCSLSIGMT